MKSIPVVCANDCIPADSTTNAQRTTAIKRIHLVWQRQRGGHRRPERLARRLDLASSDAASYLSAGQQQMPVQKN
jgi:hypothetical protein